MTKIDLGNACFGFDETSLSELKEIASQYRNSLGIVVKLTGLIGNKVEDVIEHLPGNWSEKVEGAAELALDVSYKAATYTQPGEEDSALAIARNWTKGERWHKVTTAISGAIGGFGGFGTTLAELPVTTTLILRSIQQIAQEHGEDLTDEAVRKQCIAVFGFGGPLTDDDDFDFGLFTVRVALARLSISELLKTILPKFGVAVSTKMAAQAAPVLGAATGAAVNTAFTNYYQSMAHVHFRLRKLERSHDPELVQACFERIMNVTKKAA
ncbi:MAG: EcsC family protein [Sphingomonadaceae bacterium]